MLWVRHALLRHWSQQPAALVLQQACTGAVAQMHDSSLLLCARAVPGHQTKVAAHICLL